MDEQYFRLKNFNHEDADNAPWTFSAYWPDLIVVNLRTHPTPEGHQKLTAKLALLLQRTCPPKSRQVRSKPAQR